MAKFIDITGMRFNKLLVLERVENSKRSGVRFKCLCDCGNVTVIIGNSIRSGHTKSCGCGISESNTGRALSLEGMRFGRLVAIKPIGSDKYGQMKWECQCDCGNKTVVAGRILKDNRTVSCGCYNKERSIEVNTTHGYHDSPEYNTWHAMKKRCNNQNDAGYHNYGGRGITYDPRWEDFSNFIEDMGEKPRPDLAIERIDNNGNYEPWNCRWGTREEQANNRRDNCHIEYNGENKTIAEWARELKISYNCLHDRLNRWGIEKAFNTQVQQRRSPNAKG